MNVPFLGHSDGSQPVAFRSSAIVSAAEFLSDVKSLAQRLPSRAFAINLCRDRYCFAVAFAAAMMREQVSLLPSTQAPEALCGLQSDYRGVYLIVDDDLNHDCESVRVATGTGTINFTQDEIAFAPEAIAAIVFTSGSTGVPMPNPKTWGAMACGGISEARRFGLFDAGRGLIVGTVPPQHMYGLESTVIMALQSGWIMHGERPFFPVDIRSALASVETDRILVTTPVHMRALLGSGVDLPPLRLVMCATAPLPVQMARQFEARFQVEVQEVYGFTEAGMVATRRTVNGPDWRLLPQVEMREDGGRVLVRGGHIPGEQPFGDVVDVVDPEHFVLKGRSTDTVNIAGKRTSLAFLDHTICELDGVKDGAFFMPDETGEGVTRLVAFAVAPGMTREQLFDALARRIDAAFLPRPLYVIDALPRNATGKLPRQEMKKLALECAAKVRHGRVVVRRSIESTHPALAGHFPGDPIVPGVVILDEVLDAVLTELSFSPDKRWAVRSAKFLLPVRPGDNFDIRLAPDGDLLVRFECRVDGHVAVSGALVQQQQDQG